VKIRPDWHRGTEARGTEARGTEVEEVGSRSIEPSEIFVKFSDSR